ncbi:MAG: uracil-DNA glycosylase [Fibrobacteres bacterium]|jgi:uracil-DNA glycosylase|nr:uracil-DNA glycosylase [Fibrobacterota bacterium]
MTTQPKLHPSWLSRLEPEFASSWFADLKAFLQSEKTSGATVYPPGGRIFAALDATPYESVRAVILGQDPYHGPGQAHGLSFSVPAGIRPPPSLVNIHKELHQDLGLAIPRHGNLERWAAHGVLLLNTCLTVRAATPLSHQGKGWERFTDRIVEILAQKADPVVFVLWGSHAQEKARRLDLSRHGVISSPHPSPLSAHRGFLGSKPFSRANELLRGWGRPEIDWSLE